MTVSDPNAESLTSRALAARDDPAAFPEPREIFGDRADDARFRSRFGTALRALWRDGKRSTLQSDLGDRLTSLA